MKMKSSELTGHALDWAVAKAWQPVYSDKHILEHATKKGFRPSTNWCMGGPIIERENITLCSRSIICPDIPWVAVSAMGNITILGPTPLIAALRCYVASKLGDEVEIPAELTQGEAE